MRRAKPGAPRRGDGNPPGPTRVGPSKGPQQAPGRPPTLSPETSQDSRWMKRALELATRGRCGASPNPMVGAVVLDSEGLLIGEGWHASCGGPHAEIVALGEAGDRAHGGTLYVTLEPCAHHGKTPPCVDAILAAGMRRVVFAIPDPNLAATGGADHLRVEGIEVHEGPGAGGAKLLNRRWLHWAQHRRPWVTVTASISLDGRVAGREGRSQWITGPTARDRAMELREEHDAILVGVGTIIADDPPLTRRPGINPTGSWRRIVLDSHLRTPSEAAVVRQQPETTLIVHTADVASEDRRRLSASGVELTELAARDGGGINLIVLLESLGQLEITALLVVGGPTVHGSFADDDLIDEIVFFVAPVLIGGDAPAAVAGRGVADLDMARRFRFESVDHHGADLEIRAVRPEDEESRAAD
ncbi:MAG: bifunctional diaminohydroxyphosphoribosylaminopyrimidine deaminase/5-amino-6-(5-phosphoribosylamino)uracil reductase RibD [Thermoanaerobaculales bacterium]